MDICKCTGGNCTEKHRCLRFTGPDTDGWQSYFAIPPGKVKGIITLCQYFIDEDYYYYGRKKK